MKETVQTSDGLEMKKNMKKYSKMILITCSNVIEEINGMILFDIVIDSKSIFDGQSDLSSSEGVTEERERVIIEDEITRNRGRRMK